ncbi:ubiquitin-protein ligase E3A-like [Lingula anatina]|uniref:Ubiquitin-protein ligase E3A n=1 Tax=Lingula anatina TaxID=7574 RepID=A0A1S3JNB8_LINAN|nr:ubiquitin-protein ligase E3A-like [Lingula anatina]|eukprot:XP_013411636.1 ubiquitin-protein ligase E3A-like [Lingula anatina]
MSANGNGSSDRGAPAASAITVTLPTRPSTADGTETDGMKRAAAKQLIEKYYYQLTDGCGNPQCTNQHCASSTVFSQKNLSKNEAAVRALDLFKQKARLCDSTPASKVPKVPIQETGEANHMSTVQSSATERPSTSGGTSSSASATKRTKTPFLTEQKVHAIIEQCQKKGDWSLLIRTVGETFRNAEALNLSFVKQPKSKEQMRSMEEDADKDKDENEKEKENQDSSSASVSPSDETDVDCSTDDEFNKVTLDFNSTRRAFEAMFSVEGLPFLSALNNAIMYLARDVEMQIRYHQASSNPDYINLFLIIMEIPVQQSPEILENAFPMFCKAMGCLPASAQARIAKVWSKFDVVRLQKLLESLQQLITVKIITGQFGRTHTISDDEGIAGAARVMKILYYASMIGGRCDQLELIKEERRVNQEEENAMHEFFQGAMAQEPKDQHQPKPDPLATELQITPIDCRKPLIPFENFINDVVNEHVEMDKDFTNYKSDTGRFSYMMHSFLLSTATKNLGMYFDNRIRMINERRTSMLQSIVHGAPTMPFLRVRVRRDHVIDDALVGLEIAARDNPQDLKKQLYVEFEGEQGIDEGGVSKEFFQLIIEEIFNPDFGMFTYDDETRRVWFNPTSFENDAQFSLIGIVLGLAIYNNVILDINFPMVVYRKLMGKKGTFEDMVDSHPTLASSLQQLLDHDGDVEDDFLLNFVIGFKDVFESTLSHPLKEKGEDIPVTNENREEYVELYADYLLNKSIEKQFRAFKRGFLMVTDESPLKMLFRPEELELLVCGSKDFDFHQLEGATDYDGGFNSGSRSVRNFWEVVHEFSEEQKRQLLQFATGSDRVPVGGLSKLKLIIARNGPDSDRLPTAHTCFNVLLLPDYSTKDKLKERLLKAITHAKGFGML